MIHSLSNEHLSVSIDTLGAELQSIKSPDGHEYLWQGSPNSWKGRSPVLFPVIGGLPDNRYTLDGKQYSMNSHGFARHREWILDSLTDNSLVFSLESGPESRIQYPFDFRFLMRYILSESTLAVEYLIENTGSGEMLFQAGGHPGFNCPLESCHFFDDYQLRFSNMEQTVQHLKKDGLLSGKTQAFELPDGILPLSHELFRNGAIILRGISSRSITLETEGGKRSVQVDFSGFPDLGIWSYPEKNAPFVCIEPWFGVDSTNGDDGDLRKKSGMVGLKPRELFQSRFSITIG